MNTQFFLTIGGQSLAGERGTFKVLNPATEEVVAECPFASPEQVDQAVKTAEEAFNSWQYSSDETRVAALNAIADKFEVHAEELAEFITLEQGKPLDLARFEVGGAIAWTRYTASLEIPVEVVEDSDVRRAELHRKPLGVVGSITPWNWPLMIAIWHVMPALRTGNTVVVKPSSMTPFNTLRMVELMNEVLPAGVINVVTGEGGIGSRMVKHEGIRKIVFTGSTPTGQTIMRSAADNLKRLTLELGGNDAGIVLPDADIDTLAPAIFQTAFINMGQTCAALKRLYVHDSQYDALVEKLAEQARAQKVGSGMTPGVNFGPVQNRDQFDLVAELVEDARQNGASVVTGGERVGDKGYFYAPTIVADITDGTRLVDEEQFGPALPVVRYSDVEDAIRRANDNPNGLGGSVWGSDIEQAKAVASRLECGTVWINNHSEVLPHCPFGGAKMSGIGTEFGTDGLLEYTQVQLLNISKG
ncbi:aldehyde dehydrogenase [Marinobacterium nitratireducens]|uniref:Aldehyde dehydrogenase n=1 Tax=Marinobacterium nitratireducens TaxID=518897 RepID=A0A917ZLA6_9GAMM|nr:aldehyde dehydrogenase family protein [Marinobacterium nitratireducens]GGO83968.1 aldehyde dehydrogenase [Marinobacterium nitratireducens]